MTAMIGGADCAPARLVTRGGHRGAEHMPAAALYRATGQIGLFGHRAAFGPRLGEAAAFAGDGRERVLAHAATISTGRTS